MTTKLRFSILWLIALTVCTVTVAARRQLTEAETSEFSKLPAESSMQTLFEDWIKENSKSYSDATEKSVRFAIFRDSLRRISEHNSKPSSYKLGLTKFADLTSEEFKAKHLTTRFQKNVRTSQSPNFMYAGVQALPKALDWRKKGAVTGIKDQGECGKIDCALIVSFFLGSQLEAVNYSSDIL